MIRKALKSILSVFAVALLLYAGYFLIRRAWISRTPQTITVSFILVRDSAHVYTLTRLKINEHDVNTGKIAVVVEGNTLTVDSLRSFFSRR